MTNKKSTKRALLLSALSLLMCVSMLIGSTFAWFTDSVTSGNNIIKSGNLDVVLEYWDGDSWEDVEGRSDILAGNLWEPGYVDVAYLRLKNAGSLALKYSLGVNIVSETEGKNQKDETFKLSDFIYYDVIEGVDGETAAYATREDALAVTTETTKISTSYSKLGSLEANSDYIHLAMVVYMPTTVGNEANHNGSDVPQIDLGINVYATQYTSEKDSFNEFYDGGAEWLGEAEYDWYTENPDATEFVLGSAEDLAGLAAIVNGTAEVASTYSMRSTATAIQDSFKGKTIKLSSDIDLKGKDWTPIGTSTRNAFYGIFDGQSHTIKNLELMPGSGKYGAGLFGNILGGSVVKNLTIDGASCNVRANCVGVVTGYVYGSATFENITVTNANVAAFGKVGGIIGLVADPGAHTITMTNCRVDGTFTGTYNMGGLAGLVLQGVTVNMTGCNTDVDFILTDTSYNKPYKQNADGTWGWAYGEWTYAAVAENFCYYDASENELFNGVAKNVEVKVSTVVGLEGVLEAAVANGEKNVVVDAQGANIGNMSYALDTKLVPAGTTVTIQNAVVEGKSYGNGVDGTVVFENCTFNNPTGAYSIHFDSGSGHVVFKNCTLKGWCSYGTAIKSVTMENCVLEGNGIYALNRFYQNATLTNCTINCSDSNLTDRYPEGISSVEGAKVELKDCTFNYCDFETANGGTIVVEGAKATSAAALQSLLNFATTDTTIALAADITGNVTVEQKANVKVVIDGKNHTYKGSITVDGKSGTILSAGLTIKNVNFDASAITTDACINMGDKNNSNNTRYVTNLTVEDCTFTGTYPSAEQVGIKTYTGGDQNLTVKRCTATKMHSLAQIHNIVNVEFEDCSVVECKNGISVGSSRNAKITNCDIAAVAYGVRCDGGETDSALVIADCDITANIPVVIRKVSKGYALTVNGTNTMTETNTEGLWCVAATNEYGDVNQAGLTAVGAEVTITVNDTALDANGVFIKK